MIVNMKQLFNEPNARVVALCDINELSDYSMFYYGGTAGLKPATELVRKQYGQACPTYRDYSQMLDKEDIDVTVEDQRLIVTGTKRYESDREEGDLRISERAFGSFQRIIPLPEKVTAEGAEATYKRGVLTLKVPKMTAPSARKIEVTGV